MGVLGGGWIGSVALGGGGNWRTGKRANGKERGRGDADINEVIGTEARSARKEHGVYCECTKSYVL